MHKLGFIPLTVFFVFGLFTNNIQAAGKNIKDLVPVKEGYKVYRSKDKADAALYAHDADGDIFSVIFDFQVLGFGTSSSKAPIDATSLRDVVKTYEDWLNGPTPPTGNTKTQIEKAVAIAKGERQGDRPAAPAPKTIDATKTNYRDHTMFDVSGEHFDSLWAMIKAAPKNDYIDIDENVKEKGEIKSVKVGGFSIYCTKLHRETSGLCRLTSEKNRNVYEDKSAAIIEYDGNTAKQIIQALDIDKQFGWYEVRNSAESTQKLFSQAGDCNINMKHGRQFCQLYYKMGSQFFVHFQLLVDMRSLPYSSMFYRPKWGLLDPSLVAFSARPMIKYDRNPVRSNDPFDFPNSRGRGGNWRDNAVRDPTGP